MASKKKTTEPCAVSQVKKQFLSADQCKATAARISAEMREDREGREKWGDQWAAYLPIGEGVYSRGKKPLHLVIPGDFDQAQAVIKHLFHPDEAAAIIAAITP